MRMLSFEPETMVESIADDSWTGRPNRTGGIATPRSAQNAELEPVVPSPNRRMRLRVDCSASHDELGRCRGGSALTSAYTSARTKSAAPAAPDEPATRE